MDELPLKELVHWVPTPLLALGFWWLLRRTFEDFEKRFTGLVQRFEKAADDIRDHETDLRVMRSEIKTQDEKLNSQAREIHWLRERSHELAEQVHILMGRDGSGPKPFPSRPPPRSGHTG